VGDYPFTTLSPQLGVVDEKTHKNPFVVADIPGLDLWRQRGPGPRKPLPAPRSPREAARPRARRQRGPRGRPGDPRRGAPRGGLSERPTVTALNKIDLLDEELRDYLREAFPGAFLVSAETGEGVEAFRDHVEGMVRRLGARDAMPATEREHRVYRPTWKGLQIGKENGGFRVTGEDVERLALKTDWESPEGVERFQRELEKSGVVGALRRAGAEKATR
jgi:GTP-binding protein